MNLASDRQERAARMRMSLEAGNDTKESNWQQQVTTFLRKRDAHRSTCRSDMRQANRDTKFPTLLSCERGELALELDFLRRERAYLQGLTEATGSLRTSAVQKLDALSDAMNTVIFAIDSGVYQTTDALLNARQKLQQKYRSSLEESLLLLRADRALTWISLLLQDGQNEGAPRFSSCFQAQEPTLRAVLASMTGSTALLPSLRKLQGCQTTGSGAMTNASAD
jgi:hypothetical protein